MTEPVITRIQRDGPPRESRNLEERFMVRSPATWRRMSALSGRLLSPRSRLRRAAVRRSILSGWDAVSRRDYELTQVRYSPDVEIMWDPEFEPLGLGGTFQGHRGLREMAEGLAEAWEQWAITPALAIDLGDRVVTLGTMTLPGTASGLELDSEVSQVAWIEDGLVVREREFLSWDKGLTAAGLDPASVAVRP